MEAEVKTYWLLHTATSSQEQALDLWMVRNNKISRGLSVYEHKRVLVQFYKQTPAASALDQLAVLYLYRKE